MHHPVVTIQWSARAWLQLFLQRLPAAAWPTLPKLLECLEHASTCLSLCTRSVLRPKVLKQLHVAIHCKSTGMIMSHEVTNTHLSCSHVCTSVFLNLPAVLRMHDGDTYAMTQLQNIPLRDFLALIILPLSAGSTSSLRRCAMCSCVKSSSSLREVDAVDELLSEHVDQVGCTCTPPSACFMCRKGCTSGTRQTQCSCRHPKDVPPPGLQYSHCIVPLGGARFTNHIK